MKRGCAPFSPGTVIGRLSLVAALCVAARTLPAAPAVSPERSLTAALALELPCFRPSLPSPELMAMSLELPGTLTVPDASELEPSEPRRVEMPTVPPASWEQEEPVTPPAPAPPGAVETTVTGDGPAYTKFADGITIKNKTDYAIDVPALLSSPLPFAAGRVLIIHTHGSEAYMMDETDVYTPTDPYRTTDEEHNVIRVGDELERVLTERGIEVVHDRTMYDYPKYNGAYTRAWKAITGYLECYPDISVVIDLHRDALMDSDGKVYKTVADIGDEPSAQVMLIAGTDFSGLSHPRWRDNLSFALKLQAEMVSRYSTLARPLCVSQYRYNQNATTGSLIVEVGTNGNTLKEALTAARCFGECLAAVLSEGCKA